MTAQYSDDPHYEFQYSKHHQQTLSIPAGYRNNLSGLMETPDDAYHPLITKTKFDDCVPASEIQQTRYFGHKIGNEQERSYSSNPNSYDPARSYSTSQLPRPRCSSSNSSGYVQHPVRDHESQETENSDLFSSRSHHDDLKSSQPLETENQILREKITRIEGELMLSEKRFEQLLLRVDSIQSTPPAKTFASPSPVDSFMTLLKDVRDRDTIPLFERRDYPKVIYWTKNEYQKDHKNGKGYLRTISTEKSGSAGFIEDINGTILDSSLQHDIRDYQRTLWSTLLRFGLAPTTWGRCTEPAKEYCFRSMRIRFPPFRYCEGHWKADTFMSLYYSQWADRPQRDSDDSTVDADSIKRENTIHPESNLSESLDSNGKLSKRRSSTLHGFGNDSKRRKTTVGKDYPDENNQVTILTSGSVATSTVDHFSFKVGRTLPGPEPSIPDLGCASTLPAEAMVPIASTSARGHQTPSPQPITMEYNSPVPQIARTPPQQGPATEATVNTETVPSAVQQVLTVAAAISATQDPTASTPSVLPNPLHQLVSAIATQQGGSLTAPVDNTNENKARCKRKDPDPNSTMRPSRSSTTARNLYSIEWCKQNKGGKRGEFAAIWDRMEKNNDPIVEEYKKRSTSLKAAKKKVPGNSIGNVLPIVEDHQDEE